MPVEMGKRVGTEHGAMIIIGCAGLFAFAAIATGATTTTLPALPKPAVYEYRIERTSAPLTLVTRIPPPSGLTDVPANKGASEPVPAPKTPTPAPTPSGRFIPRVPTRATVPLAPAPSKDRIVPFRAVRPKPRPTVALRSYPDRLTLTTGKKLRCRIIAEKPNSLSVELEGSVVVDLPKRRIAKIERRFWPK